ncbi:CDP-diacylglycerol--glycerol-3-phosphate 3-phosphatidyltransferase, mitochondrial isoform X1 [Rhincodon typus]|uniref:CDP-diacylglycerol--glycerol-3-phosphate 3-phosphatidyltransferase, mitochondrial isoform X1 n=1 Tax=Rhincodon typus TaxID=259920 RepID=UPI00202FE1D0|nr:CDP-diacylglycerol--glycerol-3-phosphate 3-phosphatidyltransferase, mitochondrial isoform X1 [Rhincodon typus]
MLHSSVMAAPVALHRLLASVLKPFSAGLTRIKVGLRRRERRSSYLLLAPLLCQAKPQAEVPSPSCSAYAHNIQRFQWIGELVPAFGISGSQVKVLSSPSEFYETMKEHIKMAKKRIVMASLYLGTGPLEQELVDCIEETLQRSRDETPISDLRVSVLLDCTRGSRGKKNSRTMLIPLLKKFPNQVRVSLYHTPDLRGILKFLLPERFNEIIGLQHIKIYLFDNNVIVSGANLSDSYFTNRQDRYVLLQDCHEIADFFEDLVNAVSDISLQLQQNDTADVKPGMIHPFTGSRKDFCAEANKRIMAVVNEARSKQQHRNHIKCLSDNNSEQLFVPSDNGQAPKYTDTWIYPIIQMKPFEIRIDEQVTETLMTRAEADSKMCLTSGYFNLTQAYMNLILGTNADYQILLASPEVNGFFGAKGVAGAIPYAYVYIARQFCRRVHQSGLQDRIRLHEYFRKDWTFHAKGLWYYVSGSRWPCLTLIGSPNFGYRSVHRDLEAQLAIITENHKLQQQLQEEQENLYCLSNEISTVTFDQSNRYVKLWVKLVTPLIKNFF